MKTTIELPDSVFRRAKSLAGARGISLKQLFTEALEEKLRNRPAGSVAAPPWLRLAGAFGGSLTARQETQRIQQRIDCEFETIEAEERV
jgi:hypothetical protein